jgi:hypothetical protein
MSRIAEDRGAIKRPPRSLDDLADDPRWVAWREEMRRRKDGTEKETKIPYDPHSGRQAKIPTDPSTWNTRDKAERRWEQLDGRGGIGIVLGDLGDGYHLLGIDLDGCVDSDGEIDDLPCDIIKRLNTYAERSPSKRGVKLFFLIDGTDINATQQLLGFDRGDPKTRKVFAAGTHQEIAIDRARYYTVTDDLLEHVPDTLRVVGIDDIRWLITEAGPQFLEEHQDRHDRDDGRRRDGHGRDESRSGYAFRFFADCKARGTGFLAAWWEMLRDDGPAGDWAREIGDRHDRQVKRAWERSSPAKKRITKSTPVVTAHELKGMEFQPLKYVVPDIIVEGLTLFAGKPKIGKSWLMLDTGNAVGNGEKVLGIKCRQGDVLYCALEDNLRRLQSRLQKLGIGQWSKRLQFRCEMPPLHEGGLDVIREWSQAVEKPTLVIIDTWVKVRPPKAIADTQYASDYGQLAELHTMALELGIAVVVVGHLRKMEAEDAFDTVSGTLGLTAAPDTIIILRRERQGYVLQVRGRDVEGMEKAIRFKPHNCTWEMLGNVEEVRHTAMQTAIIKAMQEIGKPASPKEIADEAQYKTANVSKLLQRLARDGLIFNTKHGRYSLQAPPRERDSRRDEEE